MMKLPEKLQQKLTERKDNSSLRTLSSHTDLIDFSSNDYLGFAKSSLVFDKTHQFLVTSKLQKNGATGSRLLSGNHQLYDEAEKIICNHHKSEEALIFNSGYDANIGFFSSVPQREDLILYDELIHASIRDGIKMTNAKSYKFKHNDLEHLNEMLKRLKDNNLTIYVVTESVFSMDGDSPDLIKLAQLCNKYKAYLIVDEAHAVGVFGTKGCGLVQELGLEKEIFARLITFGKALGCHGAAILGNNELKQYLINFSRSLIYTTALPPHSLATIKTVYSILTDETSKKLRDNIQHFKLEIKRLNLSFIASNSTIHCCIIPGNAVVKSISQKLKEKGFDVKPILSPTVQAETERLRFCIHAYNSKEEITEVLKLLSTFVTSP